MAGKVVNVGTLGGYLSYKYGVFFPLVVSLWSILALSGTLAGETQRGSLEFVASTGRSRRRIAIEKLSGHILMLGLAVLVAFVSIAIAGSSFAVLPGDEISVLSAFGYAIWLGLLALTAGALAFALGPFVGRGAAAGIAGFVTFAGFILNGYRAPVPELAPFANLTWWGWTYDHVPLAGQYDWASVALVAVVAIALLAIGIEAFVRRDIGVTTALPTPSMPRALLGLGGPLGRAISTNLGTAIAWGVGVGFFGLAIGGAASGFMEQLRGFAAVHRAALDGLPERRLRVRWRLPPAAVRRIRRDPRRPRRGIVRQRLGLGRDLGAVGDGARHAAQPQALGRGRWRRDVRERGHLRGAHRGRHRDRRGDDLRSDVATPLLGHAGARAVRPRTGRRSAMPSAA